MPELIQGSESRVSEFTLFSSVDLETDLSQFQTNMTTGTNPGCYEEDSDRLVPQVRTVRFRFTSDTSSTGALYYHNAVSRSGVSASNIELIDRLSTNVIRLAYPFDNATSASSLNVTLPGHSASLQTFAVNWAIVPNPDTTGDSDAVIHELTVMNENTGQVEKVTRIGFQRVADNPDNNVTSFAFRGAGESSPYSDDVLQVSVENTPLPFAVLREQWISAESVPSTNVDIPRPVPILKRATNWGNAGNFFGGQPMVCAGWHNSALTRTFSPLVNEVFFSPAGFVPSVIIAGAPDHKLWGTVPGTDFRLFMGMWRRRPVPSLANRLFVQVHMTVDDNGGTEPIHVRIYSMNHPNPALATEKTFVEHVTSGNTSGWVTFDLLPISRDRQGWTSLGLALTFDPSSINDVSFLAAAWHVVPRVVDLPEGGLLIGEEL